jgi:nucleoid-associated protein YgaU
MGLRDKYAHAIQTAKGKFHGNAQEQNGKLVFRGSVASEEQKNEIWTAIKTVPEWQSEVEAYIDVTGGGAAQAPASPKTYTVKPGDTLSKIAKMHLGDANAYMRIFEMNKDQLSDPDQIKPGQVLRIA